MLPPRASPDERTRRVLAAAKARDAVAGRVTQEAVVEEVVHVLRVEVEVPKAAVAALGVSAV